MAVKVKYIVKFKAKAYKAILKPKGYKLYLNIVVSPPVTTGFPYTFPYNLA